MKINIISHDNGVGLSRDVRLIKELLKKYNVQFIELGINKIIKSCPIADINIFVELTNPFLFNCAKKNILIPNPEWYWDLKNIKRFDFVLVKTRDSEKIFKNYKAKNVIYTSFTSEDRKMGGIKKYPYYLHYAGYSSFKNTQAVHKCWRDNNDFPILFFSRYGEEKLYSHFKKENIIDNYNKLPDEQFKILQNKIIYHVCPSEYEGFGHYIWEGLSCGAIIITTDASPMKEIVNGNGILITPNAVKKFNLGRLWKIGSKEMSKAIRRTMELSEEEREKMSKQSRKIWELNDRYFRNIFKKIFEYLE